MVCQQTQVGFEGTTRTGGHDHARISVTTGAGEGLVGTAGSPLRQPGAGFGDGCERRADRRHRPDLRCGDGVSSVPLAE